MRRLLLHALEIARVDGFETGFVERQLREPAARRHHFGRRLGTQIAVAGEAPASCRRLLDAAHARQRGETPRNVDPAVGLHLYREAAAQHLAAELGYRADERDPTLVEQRHP